MYVFVELPVLERALEDVYGADAEKAQLRDISALTDDALNAFVERLRDELMREEASQLFVSGIAYAIAIHIAPNYAERIDARTSSPSLPGYKLKRVTDWMAQHAAEDLNLDQLAAIVGLSKFHFHRLFKRAIGLSPSRYQTWYWRSLLTRSTQVKKRVTKR
jgi:AraC family transcriptional regulator